VKNETKLARSASKPRPITRPISIFSTVASAAMPFPLFPGPVFPQRSRPVQTQKAVHGEPVTTCAPAPALPKTDPKGELDRMTVKPLDATSTIAAQDFAEAHRRLLADRSIQFDLPRSDPAELPAWLVDFVTAIWPLLKVTFLIALAGAALYFLYLIARRAMGAKWPWGRKRAEDETEAWRPGEAPARQLLGEADALAAQGLYSEAAHLLLFRSIEDIDARRPDLVRPALTSRDIAALPAIPDRPRSAFLAIAMMVEQSLFAARPLAAGDWRDCRSAYEEFAFAEGWRG